MKKFLKVFIPILLITAVVVLSVMLSNTKQSLKAAEADIAGMTFTEGKVIEDTSGGGIVTVSLKKAVYYNNDNFITHKRPVSNNLEEIFCELHKNGFVKGLNNNLIKLEYTKQIVVKDSGTEKHYFLVGNYYIAVQK